MSEILNFKKWAASINESHEYSSNTFDNWKRFKLVLESTSNDIDELVASARENDSDSVKSTPGYDAVMTWFDNEGPVKGKAAIDDDGILKSLKYWNGDLSDKTGNHAQYAIDAMSELTDSNNVSKLLKKLQTASGNSKYLSYDVSKIIDAATKLKAKFEDIRKSGKQFGQKDENGQIYQPQVTLNPDTYPYRLGIIPWSISTSSGLDEYNGKDIQSGNAKAFTIWYDKIVAGELDNMLKILDSDKYVRTRAIGIKDSDKIAILNSYTAKAKKYNKNIEDALSIRLYPTSAKTTISKTKYPGEPIIGEIQYAEFKFPLDHDISKTFFLDDQAEIDPKFTNSINEFVTDIKKQIPEGAKVSEVTVKAVASTSSVPSSKYAKIGGNDKLADLRLSAIENKATEALSANKLNVNVKLDKTGKLANNGPAYDKVKYGLEKRQADPNVRAEYEKIYGEYRFSGLQIMISYTIQEITPTVEDVLDIMPSGEWKSSISWTDSSNIHTSNWKPGRFKPRLTKGPGLYPTKPGTKCADFCPKW
jgi:hypothetical protein